jgi:hypothetical protein
MRWPKTERRRRNNVALIEPDAVTLKCGHTIVAHPVAILPSHRRLYACPTCGTLQKAKVKP